MSYIYNSYDLCDYLNRFAVLQNTTVLPRYLLYLGPQYHVAKFLSHSLSEKYFWRDWFVLVYPKSTDDLKGENAFVRLCGEVDTYYKREGWNGKLNLVISSSPKDQISPLLDMPSKVARRVHGNWIFQVFTKLPLEWRSCLYPVVVVIKAEVNTALRAPKERLHTQHNTMVTWITLRRRRRDVVVVDPDLYTRKYRNTAKSGDLKYFVHVMG